MKRLIMIVFVSGLAGGASANDAFKTLAVQASAATAPLSIPAPLRAALTAREADKQAYDTLSRLFESGEYVQLYELVRQDYPNGYAVDLITSDEHGELKRVGGLIKITGYYNLARPATKFAASCMLMGLSYKGSDYNDSIAVMKLRPVYSGNTVNVEIKRNGKQMILKAANLPEGTGYGLVLAE
ncbi:MAG: hypothetical protein NTX59_00675 [Elusimicrobia bacterium]|nr:hypothetical protein [Elusimicrobiota bacterium]